MAIIGADTYTDVNIRYRYDVMMTKQETFAPTLTYAPQRVLSQAMQYSPQIMLGSPYASQSYAGSLTPQISPQVTVIPNIVQATEKTSQVDEAPMGGIAKGGGLMENITGIALIGGAALVALWYFKKKKKPRRKK